MASVPAPSPSIGEAWACPEPGSPELFEGVRVTYPCSLEGRTKEEQRGRSCGIAVIGKPGMDSSLHGKDHVPEHVLPTFPVHTNTDQHFSGGTCDRAGR